MENPAFRDPLLWSVKLFVSWKRLYSFPEGEVLTCLLSFPQRVPALQNSRAAPGAAVKQRCHIPEPQAHWPYLPDPLLSSSQEVKEKQSQKAARAGYNQVKCMERKGAIARAKSLSDGSVLLNKNAI